MHNHDIVVIGGSTGAMEPLQQVFSGLPGNLPAAILVVRHIAADGPDLLADILDRAGPIGVSTAADGVAIERGHAYVAPANHHLLVDPGTIRLGRGPRENMVRPAVDALFRSAAASYGSRAVGVVLSGLLDDGAAGLSAIKRCGGLAVVQDPLDAQAADMPLTALEACDVDYRVPAARLASLLTELAQAPAGPTHHVPADIALEVQIAAGRPATPDLVAQIAKPVALSCPACGGVLSQLDEPSRLRFRCQIGHAYSADALDKEQEAAVVAAVVVAVRVLEERHTLLAKMAQDAQRRGRRNSAADFEQRAEDYRRQAEMLRQSIIDRDGLP